MMKHSILFTLALAVSMPIVAQTPFDKVLDIIIDNNTELQAQRHEIKALSLEDADANALNDPEVSFAHVWGRHDIGNKLQLDISQSFNWPGVYGARKEASNAKLTLGEIQWQTARLELTTQVRELLVELVYVRQQLQLIEGLKENFSSLSAAIDQGVRGGELTIIDSRKMQIENFEIDNDYTNAKAREQQIISTLQSLTTAQLDLKDIITYPVLPLNTLESYLEQVPNDPGVIALNATAEVEALNAKVASRSRMPGFSVGYQHQAEMGDRFNGFTVGMNLPVFQGRKAKQAAIERQQAADESRQMAIAKYQTVIEGTYAELQLQSERIKAYNKAFGDHQYLTLLLKAYNGGQLSVIEYLTEIHYYHQTLLTYLDAEYNYNLALSRLQRFAH